jgi:prophage tail gpP-like protein
VITLEVAGVRYTNFLSLGVERSIENVYGTFNFTATYAPTLGFPIKRRSPCRVLVNNIPILTGFVESIDVQYGATSHTVNVRGSDATIDVYQSQLDSNVEFTAPISLQNVILNTLSTINITNMQVINEAVSLLNLIL